jgi:hypothetical protein
MGGVVWGYTQEEEEKRKFYVTRVSIKAISL